MRHKWGTVWASKIKKRLVCCACVLSYTYGLYSVHTDMLTCMYSTLHLQPMYVCTYILRTCLILPVTSYKMNDTPYHCFNIFLIFSFLFVARFTLLQDRQDRCWKRFSRNILFLSLPLDIHVWHLLLRFVPCFPNCPNMQRSIKTLLGKIFIRNLMQR